MAEAETSLNSSRKAALKQQSVDLRVALKEFERTFAEQNNGRKPKHSDIKNDASIANKYKQYQQVQSVLIGKIPYEQLIEQSPRRRPKEHRRIGSGISSSPQRVLRSLQATPRKFSRTHELDPYDTYSSVSPKPFLLDAIGPTPHRDGKVLGLFDLLPGSVSGKSSVATPSSSARKRKIDELYFDTPAKRQPLKVIQTPSRTSAKQQGDLQEYLVGTHQKSLELDVRKHLRTPQSEGKRFELSQFFASPSTRRFLFPTKDEDTVKKTPLREGVMNATPQKLPDTTGCDATPAYLKRSTSFKDRLLSAQQTSSTGYKSSSGIFARVGPPTLQHFRSSTGSVPKIVNVLQKTQQTQQKQIEEDGDFDDELEAMHEAEAQDEDAQILVEDSQFGQSLAPNSDGEEELSTILKPYKKKGQKRTTKKANIRPVAQKATKEPKYVAADNFGDPDDETDRNNEEAVEDTRFMSDDDDGEYNQLMNEPDEYGTAKKQKMMKILSKTGKPKKQAGMINPNAQSHMNFKSLKIKNKNSKAKGAGRAKFGRGRR